MILVFFHTPPNPFFFIANVFHICCFFVFSDWYFWIPLYAIASIVNLLQRKFNQVTRFVLWSGLLLFIRVMIEGHVYGLANLWSMDMRKRVVREKVGSGLVVASMTLHLKASQISKLFVTLGEDFHLVLH